MQMRVSCVVEDGSIAAVGYYTGILGPFVSLSPFNRFRSSDGGVGCEFFSSSAGGTSTCTAIFCFAEEEALTAAHLKNRRPPVHSERDYLE